jgi:RNA polymerase sigma-B factor
MVTWGSYEMRLLARARHHGDQAALEELATRMLPLARRLAGKYKRRRESLDDLVQVASVGLVKALNRYDPERGVDFVGFAVPTITGELKRYYRDTCWSVHVPRALQERSLRVERELRKLSVELGRSATPADLAERLDLTREEVLEARLAADAYTAVSLDAPDSDDGNQRRSDPGVEDRRFRLVEEFDALACALRVLPTRERRIIALRFGEELTQQEIADRIGLSQMHVSRLLDRALDRVRIIATKDSNPLLAAAGAER